MHEWKLDGVSGDEQARGESDQFICEGMSENGDMPACARHPASVSGLPGAEDKMHNHLSLALRNSSLLSATFTAPSVGAMAARTRSGSMRAISAVVTIALILPSVPSRYFAILAALAARAAGLACSPGAGGRIDAQNWRRNSDAALWHERIWLRIVSGSGAGVRNNNALTIHRVLGITGHVHVAYYPHRYCLRIALVRVCLLLGWIRGWVRRVARIRHTHIVKVHFPVLHTRCLGR